jgi:putative MFS transporter
MLSLFKYPVVWIAAFGYFVDLYDLVLYGVVRVQSLTALGIAPTELFNVGSNLLNLQMLGMLLGGLIWGIIGDRKGRRAA